MGRYDYEGLKSVIAKLRAPDGCPWDREQTHESLKRYLIEETYEVLEAIDSQDPGKICDELGDVLLQVVLHAQIAKENGQFDLDDVVNGVASKMVSRHRHVFGDARAETADDVVQLWEDIKKVEKGHPSATRSLKDVPPHLPALMRSYKVQSKAAKVGFDWPDIQGAWDKVDEEIIELEEAVQGQSAKRIEEEVGDLLFAVVNVSRFLKVQPELALSGTTEKFIRRFAQIEAMAAESGKTMEELTLAEMDVLWDGVKAQEKQAEG